MDFTGGFVCNCQAGFEAIGAYPITTYIDIGECYPNVSVVAGCGSDGVCINNTGAFSFECIQVSKKPPTTH